MNLPRVGKDALRAALNRLGYRLQRLSAEERLFNLGYDPGTPLPADASVELHVDHPRLLDLQRRYAAFDSPVCRHTQWRSELTSDAASLRYFRGENAYLWNYLKLDRRVARHEEVRLKYYLYACYIRELDKRKLLGGALVEDGLFGCFSFRFEQMPTVSRDLLDSINELYFLDRHWNLFGRDAVRVLDIGAGYGRLAHRMLASHVGVKRYWCVDAIPRSTFLCEYYLRHRRCLGSSDSPAVVIAVDEMEAALRVGDIDLAINIHSFSEMSHTAIEAWLLWLAQLKIEWLMIVPNEPRLHSREADGSRRDCAALLEAAGYQLTATEPAILDVDVRELFGVHDYFFLYRRA